jgi:hypothetical protein
MNNQHKLCKIPSPLIVVRAMPKIYTKVNTGLTPSTGWIAYISKSIWRTVWCSDQQLGTYIDHESNVQGLGFKP